MKIAHISDLHLVRGQSMNGVRKVFERIVDLEPDHIVITGDLVDDGNIEEAKKLKKLLKEFGVFDRKTTTVIPGNHDVFTKLRARGQENNDKFTLLFRDLLDESIDYMAYSNSLSSSIKYLDDMALILVDTMPYAQISLGVGSIDNEEIAKLKREFRANQDRVSSAPVFVVMHHDPLYELEDLADYVRPQSWLGIGDTEPLRHLVKAVKPNAILCGHIHCDDRVFDEYDDDNFELKRRRFCGVPVLNAGYLGMAKESAWSGRAPAFNFYKVSNDGQMLVKTILCSIGKAANAKKCS